MYCAQRSEVDAADVRDIQELKSALAEIDPHLDECRNVMEQVKDVVRLVSKCVGMVSSLSCERCAETVRILLMLYCLRLQSIKLMHFMCPCTTNACWYLLCRHLDL